LPAGWSQSAPHASQQAGSIDCYSSVWGRSCESMDGGPALQQRFLHSGKPFGISGRRRAMALPVAIGL
jgi:hypothetical protein